MLSRYNVKALSELVAKTNVSLDRPAADFPTRSCTLAASGVIVILPMLCTCVLFSRHKIVYGLLSEHLEFQSKIFHAYSFVIYVLVFDIV